ncbi:RluA family pseudouridine synthase [Cognaticolwellia beringensis]|uniref:RNA pseudouridine synthase n=1 Tax=Cognaticolwellia beringensis TaxID=1967665 RepID=A0A222G913_9GAMM|nr:RluA family pseudouridine synthase [Cognaticolwellia beringensis]ASP48357.1 RNA pseudouridine synthase [Cognaticolwellia beringensis]
MTNLAPCFTLFSQSTDNIVLPEKFTFPFYYQPQQIAVEAVQQLQQQLEKLPQCLTKTKASEVSVGKMFGVLVVKNCQGIIGFLSAYSGQIESDNTDINFVPAVSNMQLQDSAFLAENNIINNINAEIEQLESSPQLSVITNELNEATAAYQQELSAQQSLIVASRQQRKQQRNQAVGQLSTNDFEQLKVELAGQSIQEKKQLQALKQSGQNKLELLQQTLAKITDEIAKLRKLRKSRSKSLQKKLFAEYNFLNAHGETKDLNAIFAELPEHTPPAGAGDCAAPKLLQYAYQHNLKPIAMAEFWWGNAPKSAVRQHKNYYPSCYSKCQPILTHMLKGLHVDDNPLLINPAQGKDLAIVYQDSDMLVVNKPAEFLSVPGKNIEDSVYMRIKTQFPQASGPLIVHRLDMSTSGLLIIALNKRAHKALQKQFIERSIEKRYVALVAGSVVEDSGTIELPLMLDFDDKPRQLVCYQHGKHALTTWRVLERKNNTTRLHLFPKTGRTHQLRVHCAHKLGLNMPIVGDDHYGLKADRLHLHAEYLSLSHPIKHTKLEFEVAADF